MSFLVLHRALAIKIWQSQKVCIWIRVIQSNFPLKNGHKSKKILDSKKIDLNVLNNWPQKIVWTLSTCLIAAMLLAR